MSGYNVIPMIKVFAGSNWFGIKSALDAEVQNFLSENSDINIERFYGPDDSLDDIKAALGSVSLFSDKKLVIVEQLSAHKDSTENIDEIFRLAEGDNLLIVVEPNIDKRSSYYKNLKKLEGFNEFNELDENSLATWIKSFAGESVGDISLADARYLMARVGSDQANLRNELTKLMQYDHKITKQSIDLLTEQTPTSTIFNLVDMAFSGDIKKSLLLYDEQRKLRVEPQAIFGMMVWQMHLVALCLTAGSKTANEISAQTGMSSYVLGKAKAIATKMGKDRIIEYLDLLRDIEKTSRKQAYNFDDAMKLAITKLAY